MNKKMMVLAASFFLVGGLASARPGGFGGGFNGGGHEGGGGNIGGGNAGNSGNSTSTDNTDNHRSHSGGHVGNGGTHSSGPAYHNGGGWGHGNTTHSFNRSGGYSNYHSHNGWNQPSQGVHHFNRYNNASGFQGNHNYRGFNNNGFNHHSAISQNLRNMGINHVPRPLAGRSVLPNGFRHSVPGMPHQGPSGHPFNSPALSPNRMSSAAARTQMATIAGNHHFMAQVAATTPGALRNHYYWHNWNGYNYCNYWDGYGNCWYGWNCGAGFFWTQYYGGNWWWYDPWWGNWCWWDNGNWWWENPATTTVYVYNNGNYTQADSSNDGDDDSAASNSDDYGGPVYGDNSPQGQPSVDNGSREANQAGSNGNALVDFLSQDGSVKVTVSAEGDAFLYRMKNDKPSGKPVYLDSNVEEVKFSNSGTKNEKILLIFKDGSFTTLNADGSKA